MIFLQFQSIRLITKPKGETTSLCSLSLLFGSFYAAKKNEPEDFLPARRVFNRQGMRRWIIAMQSSRSMILGTG